jgi:geranylgeranyl pyrophosphate synthase
MHKTDIIKFKFDDFNATLDKYKKLKLVNKDTLIDHINKTYGATCQCAFVVGWLLGLGDHKMINNLERLGTHLGLLIKLANDFVNLERDIKYTEQRSVNMLVNYGVHQSFDLFSDSKVKLIEGTMTFVIYNPTIKEVIYFIEKKFDMCLNNTELELDSKYSSFSDMS